MCSRDVLLMCSVLTMQTRVNKHTDEVTLCCCCSVTHTELCVYTTCQRAEGVNGQRSETLDHDGPLHFELSPLVRRVQLEEVGGAPGGAIRVSRCRAGRGGTDSHGDEAARWSSTSTCTRSRAGPCSCSPGRPGSPSTSSWWTSPKVMLRAHSL